MKPSLPDVRPAWKPATYSPWKDRRLWPTVAFEAAAISAVVAWAIFGSLWLAAGLLVASVLSLVLLIVLNKR